MPAQTRPVSPLPLQQYRGLCNPDRNITSPRKISYSNVSYLYSIVLWLCHPPSILALLLERNKKTWSMVKSQCLKGVNMSKSETKISDCFRGYCRPILTAALSIEQTKSRECPNARSWHNAPDLGVSQIRRQALVAMSQKSALPMFSRSALNGCFGSTIPVPMRQLSSELVAAPNFRYGGKSGRWIFTKYRLI